MKKFKIIPSEQRVIIFPDLKPEKTAGGIIIPASADDNLPEFGTIIASGKGEKDIPMRYYCGDRVLYSEYAGTEVELNLDGEVKKYKVMNQMDIMARIEEVNE